MLFYEMNNIPHYLTTINNDITIKKYLKMEPRNLKKFGLIK